MPEISFNPWDPEFRANPYPFYTLLRQGPPLLLEFPQAFVAFVTRYDDVDALLDDTETLSNVRMLPRETLMAGPFGGAQTMLTSDPPTHSRLRHLVSRDFTPKRVRDLEPDIRSLTSELLDKVETQKGVFEVMGDLAIPLPVMVIANMLGIDRDHYGIFKAWSDAIVSGNNPNVSGARPFGFHEAVAAIRGYFTAEIEKRRRRPGEDLLSALVAAHDDAEALTEDELLAFVVLLLLAGNETTTTLIGNALLALARNPDQFERLRAEANLMPKAIEEFLRYDGPVQAVLRYTKQNVNLRGTDVPAKTAVFLALASANRDPAQFTDPDTLDLGRSPNNHVAFGHGIHFCLGATLARLEAAIALGAVLERFPRLRLTDPEGRIAYRGSFALRSPDAIQMRVE